MSDNIITLNSELIHTELKDLVRNSVEETLNSLLDAEADRLVNAKRYARDEERQGCRSGHYDRNFTTTSGDVNLRVPKHKGLTFETAIIERYKRRVEDITEALWGTKVSPGTISNLNKKAYENIEKWRNRSLADETYPYVYVDGIFLKRSWGGEFENVSILVAVGVSSDGHREILGAAEGLKEDLESCVLHSDRGSQYISKAYREVTEKFQLSYSHKGYPYDNACIESFHSLIKCEWLDRFKIRDFNHAYGLVFEYVEAFTTRFESTVTATTCHRSSSRNCSRTLPPEASLHASRSINPGNVTVEKCPILICAKS